MADSNDSTTSNYSDFAGKLINDLFQAKALAMGVDCIINDGTKWEESEELGYAKRLINILDEQLGSVISSLDRTQFEYTIKQQ